MRFCPTCNYFLYLSPASADSSSLILQCRHCGYNETMMPESSKDALILETTFKNTGLSAGLGASGVTVNSYTLSDPTLPHTKSLRCPNSSCASAGDAEKRDVIYIKTDSSGLKFQYICTVCSNQWRSQD
jgi:DNA-directed RNA polymerase subunit M/transcription elongation factor TFIIS